MLDNKQWCNEENALRDRCLLWPPRSNKLWTWAILENSGVLKFGKNSFPACSGAQALKFTQQNIKQIHEMQHGGKNNVVLFILSFDYSESQAT